MANDALVEIALLGWHMHLEARNSGNERQASFIDSQECACAKRAASSPCIGMTAMSESEARSGITGDANFRSGMSCLIAHCAASAIIASVIICG